MKTTLSRLMSVILVLATVLAFSSCADIEKEQPEVSNGPVNTESDITVETLNVDDKGYLKDNLPDNIKFNNETFTVLY